MQNHIVPGFPCNKDVRVRKQLLASLHHSGRYQLILLSENLSKKASQIHRRIENIINASSHGSNKFAPKVLEVALSTASAGVLYCPPTNFLHKRRIEEQAALGSAGCE
eukprot:747445-Hanusia_phi.AAC.5